MLYIIMGCLLLFAVAALFFYMTDGMEGLYLFRLFIIIGIVVNGIIFSVAYLFNTGIREMSLKQKPCNFNNTEQKTP